jgi:predicted ATPase/class 3 adenylate cyclase
MLFTDIVGSTRLLQQLGETYRAVITDHHRLLRQAILPHGHEVEDRGDGLFAVFGRAVDALNAAVAAQRAVAVHPWPDRAAVQVRVGLHTGDPALVGTNYVGLDVHRAARLCEAGHGGQILLSAATRELVDRTPPDGVTLRDLGEHRLRDLLRPERIFQAVVPGLPADFPPPRAVNARPNNLPVTRGRLIGRDTEVSRACDLLLQEDIGLVTLTGPGGAGKTRVGLQTAAALLNRIDDGVFLVLLAPISDPALVPATIAQALGLRAVADRPVLDVVIEYLRERRVLLLLDNFEQILPAAPAVADLLAACPRLRILVTSRAPLRLRGERELPVPPLALPMPGEDLSVERVGQYAAVTLFVERARETRPDFAITAENASAIAAICARLDGLPLAIELAAARVRLLGPQAMLGRLGRRLPFLTGGSRDLPARQQTLRDTIGWSYDLLHPAEQRVYRRLGVFAGGFTLDSAEGVAGGASTDDGAILDAVESLIDNSLVRQVAGLGRELRFTMLETIREFALEQLEVSGEADQIRRRHAEYFAAFCEQAEPQLIRASDSKWFDRVDDEHDNIRAALAWSGESESAHELMPRLANPLWIFWWLRGHWTEGSRWYERILELSVQPPGRLGALRGRGQFAVQAGDFARAARCWDEAITLARQLGDLHMLSTALGRRAHTAGQVGDPARAVRLADEGLAVARHLGDPVRVALAWNDIGNAACAAGDNDRGRQAHEEALRRAREAGVGFYVPYALQALTSDAIDRGELERAMALAEEAIGLFQCRGDRWGALVCLGRLARIARLRGEPGRTAALAREALVISREIGSTPPIADNLRHLAWAAHAERRPERAAVLIGAAIAIHKSTGRPIYPSMQRDVDAETAVLRETLGDEVFEVAWQEGRAMSTDSAVRYALEKIDVDPGGPRAWPS